MNEDDVEIESFAPSFLEDGLGISGGQTGFPPFQEFGDDWDTRPYTMGGEADDEPTGQGCTPPGTPDTTKKYFRATHFVNGHWQCYWEESTSCP